MVFSILDHVDQFELVKESNTQITVRCPVCGHKVQICKRKGAYFCVAGCETKEIRANLNLPFSNYTFHKNAKYIPPTEIPLPRKIDLHEVNNDYNLKQELFFHTRQQEEAVKTIYEYSPKHRVVRVDFLESKEKSFYFMSLKEGKWTVQIDLDFPLLHQNLITDKNKFIVLVEGEKCAVELVKQGLLAVTPAPFAWSEDKLQGLFNTIYYDVEGILCIPDNDEVGLKKAIRVQSAAWRTGLPCRILNLEEYYIEKGDDVVDLIKRGIEIKTLIKELL